MVSKLIWTEYFNLIGNINVRFHNIHENMSLFLKKHFAIIFFSYPLNVKNQENPNLSENKIQNMIFGMKLSYKIQGRGGWQMLTLADKYGRGGLANGDITD